MNQPLLNQYKLACVYGYSLRCIYGLYTLITKSKTQLSNNGHGVEALTSAQKVRHIFVTLEHYRFASTLASCSASYGLLLLLFHKIQTKMHEQNRRRRRRRRRRMDRDLNDNHPPADAEADDAAAENIRLDRMFAILSAMLCILWTKRLPKELRDMFVLHLFVRAVYDLIKMLKFDEDYKCIPILKHDDWLLFSGFMCFIGYGIYHNPWLFSDSYYRFILRAGSNTHAQIGSVFRSQSNPMSHTRLAGEAFVECIPEWHRNPSCVLFHARNFLKDVIRFSRMYAVVHSVPLLMSAKFYRMCFQGLGHLWQSIFHSNRNKIETPAVKEQEEEEPRRLSGISEEDEEDEDEDVEEDGRNDGSASATIIHNTGVVAHHPLLRVLKSKLIAILRSSVFFSAIQHLPKLMQCYWRHYVLRGDPVWSTVGIVFVFTALGSLCETAQRRVQYNLYIGTQILRMLTMAVYRTETGRFCFDVKCKWLREWWSTLLLSIAFGIWSYMKSVHKDSQYCGRLSAFIMNIIL